MTIDFFFSSPLPPPLHHTPLQAHQLAEAQKRKAVDKNNPTLYWEYKWTEDAEAEVHCSVLHSIQLKYKVSVAWSKLRPSISGRSRGRTQGTALPPPPPFLFWVKRKKNTRGRKLTGQVNQLPPSLTSRSGLSMALHSCLFPLRALCIKCTPPSHLN